MAMTKKEQQEMEALRNELAIARAFRFTEKVKTDAPVPNSPDIVNGWSFHFYMNYIGELKKSCSKRGSHGMGQWGRTTSQDPIEQYSTRLLALRGLRNEMERKFAEALARVDAEIEQEQKGGCA